MEPSDRATAEAFRRRLSRGPTTPAELRAALLSVAPVDRDAWVDVALGLDSVPDDEPSLPRGCVPYLPCPVDALLRAVDVAAVQSSDVFVDVGVGVGRAAALVHLLTGAAVVGIDVQPAMVRASRELMARLDGARFAAIEGDASELVRLLGMGTVYFLYCPFGGARLERFLDGLEPVARTRPIRLCSVDLVLPPRAWLVLESPPGRDLAVYRSAACSGSSEHVEERCSKD